MTKTSTRNWKKLYVYLLQATENILDDLREKVKEQHIKEPADCRELLIESIREQMDRGRDGVSV